MEKWVTQAVSWVLPSDRILTEAAWGNHSLALASKKTKPTRSPLLTMPAGISTCTCTISLNWAPGPI